MKNRFKPKEVWKCELCYSYVLNELDYFVILDINPNKREFVDIFNISKNSTVFITHVAFKEWEDSLFFKYFRKIR